MPFRNIPFSRITDDEPDELLRPWLRVRIYNPETGESIHTYGLVDTGADYCAIPDFWAPSLGHDLKKGVPECTTGAGGECQGYTHNTKIEILNNDYKVGITIEDGQIHFLKNLPCVLLGVKGFLENLHLSIDYPNRKFTLKRQRKSGTTP